MSSMMDLNTAIQIVFEADAPDEGTLHQAASGLATASHSQNLYPWLEGRLAKLVNMVADDELSSVTRACLADLLARMTSDPVTHKELTPAMMNALADVVLAEQKWEEVSNVSGSDNDGEKSAEGEGESLSSLCLFTLETLNDVLRHAKTPRLITGRVIHLWATLAEDTAFDVTGISFKENLHEIAQNTRVISRLARGLERYFGERSDKAEFYIQDALDGLWGLSTSTLACRLFTSKAVSVLAGTCCDGEWAFFSATALSNVVACCRTTYLTPMVVDALLACVQTDGMGACAALEALGKIASRPRVLQQCFEPETVKTLCGLSSHFNKKEYSRALWMDMVGALLFCSKTRGMVSREVIAQWSQSLHATDRKKALRLANTLYFLGKSCPRPMLSDALKQELKAVVLAEPKDYQSWELFVAKYALTRGADVAELFSEEDIDELRFLTQTTDWKQSLVGNLLWLARCREARINFSDTVLTMLCDLASGEDLDLDDKDHCNARLRAFLALCCFVMDPLTKTRIPPAIQHILLGMCDVYGHIGIQSEFPGILGRKPVDIQCWAQNFLVELSFVRRSEVGPWGGAQPMAPSKPVPRPQNAAVFCGAGAGAGADELNDDALTSGLDFNDPVWGEVRGVPVDVTNGGKSSPGVVVVEVACDEAELPGLVKSDDLSLLWFGSTPPPSALAAEHPPRRRGAGGGEMHY